MVRESEGLVPAEKSVSSDDYSLGATKTPPPSLVSTAAEIIKGKIYHPWLFFQYNYLIFENLH